MTQSRGIKKNHIVRDAWLLMLKEGGRWSTTEIRSRLGLDEQARSFHANIFSMARNGYATRYEPEPGKYRGAKYGVTLGCKVPLGVRVDQILELAEKT